MKVWILFFICLLPWMASAEKSYYLIGNSLTWDTVPSRLDGNVQWHVDCGKSLAYIQANPTNPCVKSSTLWPDALTTNQYDYLVLQPHYEPDLAGAVDTLSHWIDMQPNAIIVIHSGWAAHTNRVAEYKNGVYDRGLEHSPIQHAILLEMLETKYPDRTFKQTKSQDMLQTVAEGIASGKAPLEDLSELYRDKIHLTINGGRYFMHNLIRLTLDQPASSKGWEGEQAVPPALKKYLNSVLADVIVFQ